jgi:hypothetical protein
MGVERAAPLVALRDAGGLQVPVEDLVGCAGQAFGDAQLLHA